MRDDFTIGGTGVEDVFVESDLVLLKRTVKSFVAEQVAVLEQSQKDYLQKLPTEQVELLQSKARKAGLFALGAKDEWGGAGVSLFIRSVIYEEAAKHRLGLYHPAADAFGEELPSFLEQCTLEQIETYVKPAIERGKGCFIALWEEQEDNQMERLRCEAVNQDGHWVLNGHKSYIQKLEQSSFGITLVNCLGDKGAKEPTLFILAPTDSYELKETVLMNVQTRHGVILKDVRLSDDRRIGKVGEGSQLIKQWLAEAQVLLGARCLGVAEKAMHYARDYAKLRITRGRPLIEFPAVQTMIAESVLNTKAARLMVHDAAKKIDAGEKDGRISAKLAKLFATEAAAKIIDDSLQICGGSGYAGDLPIERWYKEIRLARVDLEKKETILEEIARMDG